MKLKVNVRDVITKQEQEWEFKEDPQTEVFFRVDNWKCYCLHYEIPAGYVMSVISLAPDMLFKFSKRCPKQGHEMLIELNQPFGSVRRDERYIVLDVCHV